jgi:hypothetical protein
MGVAERDSALDDEQQLEEGQDTVEGAESQDDTVTGGDGEDTISGGQVDEVEDVVQIGDEEPPASEETKAAPAWVKELRQRQRELARENAELKAQLGTGKPANSKPELPAKPKLADHDYDEDAYEKARDEWDAKKRELDSWEANQAERTKAAQKAVQTVHENYATSKKALKVPDFQDAEDEVVGVLTEVQQSILMAGAANPGAMVYALGKTPKKLQELASIKDPVKFAVAVGKLETEVKVTKRTSTKPAPETTVTSRGSNKTSTATLERLQAEADKTGDRTKVAAFLRNQRQAGK